MPWKIFQKPENYDFSQIDLISSCVGLEAGLEASICPPQSFWLQSERFFVSQKFHQNWKSAKIVILRDPVWNLPTTSGINRALSGVKLGPGEHRKKKFEDWFQNKKVMSTSKTPKSASLTPTQEFWKFLILKVNALKIKGKSKFWFFSDRANFVQEEV